MTSTKTDPTIGDIKKKEAIDGLKRCHHGLLPRLLADIDRLDKIVHTKELTDRIAYTQNLLGHAQQYLAHELKNALLRQEAFIKDVETQDEFAATVPEIEDLENFPLARIPSTYSPDGESPTCQKLASVKNAENHQELNPTTSATDTENCSEVKTLIPAQSYYNLSTSLSTSNSLETNLEQDRNATSEQREVRKPAASTAITNAETENSTLHIQSAAENSLVHVKQEQNTTTTAATNTESSTSRVDIPSAASINTSSKTKRKASTAAEKEHPAKKQKPNWEENGWGDQGREGQPAPPDWPGIPPKYPFSLDGLVSSKADLQAWEAYSRDKERYKVVAGLLVSRTRSEVSQFNRDLTEKTKINSAGTFMNYVIDYYYCPPDMNVLILRDYEKSVQFGADGKFDDRLLGTRAPSIHVPGFRIPSHLMLTSDYSGLLARLLSEKEGQSPVLNDPKDLCIYHPQWTTKLKPHMPNNTVVFYWIGVWSTAKTQSRNMRTSNDRMASKTHDQSWKYEIVYFKWKKDGWLRNIDGGEEGRADLLAFATFMQMPEAFKYDIRNYRFYRY